MQGEAKGETAEKHLSVEDFEAAFGEKLSPYVAGRIREYSFRYAEFSPEENEAILVKIVETLLGPSVVTSGEHRRDQWEAGWHENLDLLLRQPNNVASIVPKYFNKYGAIRWRGRYIRPLSEQFEYRSLAIIQDWLFDQYLRD